jgi:uncharacterized protein (TIRG00374 family)
MPAPWLTAAVGTWVAREVGVRALAILLLAGGVLAALVLTGYAGAESIEAALVSVTWWQLALIAALSALSMVIDTLGWRYALPRNRARFRTLFAARCAGEAVNVLTLVASVGGEAMKAWLLRRHVPYEDSVPSLIIAKTAEVVAQTGLLLVAVAVGWLTGSVGSALLTVIGYLLVVEILAVGGFVWVQTAGVIGKGGRLASWAGIDGPEHARRLDAALRGFYRDEWPRFLKATGVYFAGWLLGAVEARVILDSLAVPGSLTLAVMIAGLESAVRFATFFVPGNVGVLEGSNAAAFGALGLGATAGLTFTLVRRARQALWIVLGLLVLATMRRTAWVAAERSARAPILSPSEEPSQRLAA